MPIYVFLCKECGNEEDFFCHKVKDRPSTIKCSNCGKDSNRVMSRFNTSPQLFKKLSGIDDTEDLTLGKIVADRKIPTEFKRKLREKDSRIKKFNEELKRRKQLLKFQPNSGDFD